ncbi:MAG: hypothetical protein ACHRHE_13740 [Tepidisphaerales bacterium]
MNLHACITLLALLPCIDPVGQAFLPVVGGPSGGHSCPPETLRFAPPPPPAIALFVAPEQGPDFADEKNILAESSDRDRLEAAAVALARSGNEAALAILEAFLKDKAFLARLDELGDPQQKTRRLGHIMAALATHPTPAVADLCLRLRGDPAYTSDDDRIAFLLTAAAAVSPMDKPTVEFFRETAARGYFALNARLLAANGSAPALSLLQSMVTDETVPLQRRIDALHEALPTHRTDRGVIETAGHILASKPVEAIANGVLESIFEFRAKEWFGTHPPTPAPWNQASPEAAAAARRLAATAIDRPTVPPSLRKAIEAAVSQLPAESEPKQAP